VKRIAFLLFLLSAEIAQIEGQGLIAYMTRPESIAYAPYVREITYIVETITSTSVVRQAETMYCLYVGSKETERIDQQAAEAHTILNVSLAHPVPAVAAGLRVQDSQRWYAIFTDSDRNFASVRPLFEESTWSKIPVLVRHVLGALGADDQNLILVSWNGLSGSVSIFYQPRFDHDRAFYEEKRKVLMNHMETWDVGEPLPNP
jgi:hypothetical protein